jgi:hypothetical protein
VPHDPTLEGQDAGPSPRRALFSLGASKTATTANFKGSEGRVVGGEEAFVGPVDHRNAGDPPSPSPAPRTPARGVAASAAVGQGEAGASGIRAIAS